MAENAHPLRKTITFLHRTFSWIVYLSTQCIYYAYKIVSIVRRYLGLSSSTFLLKEKAIDSKTLEELEGVDEEMQKQFGPCLKQKFSWSVLHEFYYLCQQRQGISEQEQKDPDWGRHHFMEFSLELRKSSVARALSTLS